MGEPFFVDVNNLNIKKELNFEDTNIKMKPSQKNEDKNITDCEVNEFPIKRIKEEAIEDINTIQKERNYKDVAIKDKELNFIEYDVKKTFTNNSDVLASNKQCDIKRKIEDFLEVKMEVEDEVNTEEDAFTYFPSKEESLLKSLPNESKKSKAFLPLNVTMDTLDSNSESDVKEPTTSQKQENHMLNKDPIYSYYKPVECNKKVMTCNHCKKEISRGSEKGKAANTSNLVNHLKVRSHPLLYEEYLKQKVIFSQLRLAKGIGVQKPQSSPASVTKRPTNTDLMKNNNKWRPNSSQSKELDRKIIEMIAIGNYPFTLVNEEGFLRVVEFLNPQAQLKSDKFYREKLHSTYEAVVIKIREILNTAEYLSFTTDIWTNKAKTESLISFTGHYVDFNSKSKPKIFFAAKPITTDHTGEEIKKLLEELCITWEIPINKIHGIVHDNSTNIVRAIKLSELFQDFRCLAHTFQLSIQESMNSQSTVTELLSVARSIVGHFTRSEQSRQRLNEIQQNHGFRELQMVQSVATCWNSIYLMLERLLEQKDALALYEARYDVPSSLTPNQWKIAESMCNLLYPFYDITKVISADDTSCSVTIPFVKNLMNVLRLKKKDDREKFYGIETMKRTLLESLERRFESELSEKNLMLATFLDPRFKKKYFTEAQMRRVSTLLKEDSKPTDNEIELTQVTQPSVSAESEYKEETIQPQKRQRKSIWDFETEYCNQDSEGEPQPSLERDRSVIVIEKEIEDYLQQPKVPQNTNIYEWWANSNFTMLKLMAQKYLSTPATSVPSEQLFSTAEEIYDDNRYNLKDENAEKLLFLNKNLRILNFRY